MLSGLFLEDRRLSWNCFALGFAVAFVLCTAGRSGIA